MPRQKKPSAAAVTALSPAPKAPRSSSTVVAGSRSRASPSAAGTLRNSTVRSTRETVSTSARPSVSAACCASRGKAAVASAMPKRATGRLAMSQAKVRLEMALAPTREAKKVVVTAKLTCAAASPITRGPISRATSRVGPSSKSKRQR